MSRLFALLALILAVALPVPAVASDLTDRLEALARRNNGEALYHLGMIHHMGLEGATRDPRRAFDYFRRSAEAGDPLGAYKLGCFYAGQGEGVIADDAALALRYKLVAAEAGYALAQVEVSQIYGERGEVATAIRWLEAAARQGETGANFALMMLHGSSDGPQPDRGRALLYYELVRRDMLRLLAKLPAGEERPDVDVVLADIRQQAEAGATEVDRERARALMAAWREQRSPVSRKADLGLAAARRLAGLEEPAA